MTTREVLHEIVDELADDQAELARVWLEDLRDAAEADGLVLDDAALASLDHRLRDMAEGRVKSLG